MGEIIIFSYFSILLFTYLLQNDVLNISYVISTWNKVINMVVLFSEVKSGKVRKDIKQYNIYITIGYIYTLQSISHMLYYLL